MARKKNVPVEPEISDSGMGENPQYPEGEIPMEDGQDAALAGDAPGGGEPLVGDLPPDGDAFAFPEGEPPFEKRDPDSPPEPAAVDPVSDGTPPEPEGPAPEGDDYSKLLQEMGNTTPVEDAPLLLDAGSAQEPPAGINGGAASTAETPPAAEGRVRNTPPRSAPSPASSSRREHVLTIDARDEVQTQADREDIIWHEVQNAYRTRRILTGTLGGIERNNSGMTLAIADYKGFRVVILLEEMMLYEGPEPEAAEHARWENQLQRILNSRLGSEIDFVIRGIVNEERSIVASRRDAMLRKRRAFYMDANGLGEPMIYEGRVVQARVVAVAEKMVRVEVFGVECSIFARGLSWLWIGDARDHFNVGDRILVRVQKIDRTDVEHLSIQVDARSVLGIENGDNLRKCRRNGRYAGRVTDVHKGTTFIRLNNGVNAIAHACYDIRTPGKKDDVSFAVTQLDEEHGVAVGIITRIIKQNL